MKTRFQTISLLGGIAGVCGVAAPFCAPCLYRSRSAPAVSWGTPAPAAIAAVPHIGVVMSTVPVPNYKLIDAPKHAPGVTPSRSSAMLLCLGARNSLGQSIGTEVVGEEGDNFITLSDGERVLAPHDMTHRDITHAFLWTHGRKRDLGTLRGGKNSDANCINESGQVVGRSSTSSSFDAPVVWQAGKIRPLPTDQGNGEAHWINSRGDIAGEGPQACFWREGKLHLIPGLELESGTATCINNSGDVVGYSDTINSLTRAFVYRNGKTRRLSTLPDCTESWAYSINDSGDIVGEASGWKDVPATQRVPPTYPLYGLNNDRNRMTRIQVEHAVLWHDGVCIDLNKYVPANRAVRLYNARGINNAGDIFGNAQGKDGQTTFVLKRLPAVHTSASVQRFRSSPRVAQAKTHP